MGGALAPLRKYIVATEASRDVLIFNLEEKQNLDWLDLGAKPEVKDKSK